MQVFISYSHADKATAHLLAMALAGQGMTPWFDEWDVRAGDSLTTEIESGLSQSEIFVLIWSDAASRSNWVGTELRTFLRRRVDNPSLRVVPVMVDPTSLPALAADYKGFRLGNETLDQIAYEIAGRPVDVEVAQHLQARLKEITQRSLGDDILPFLICPSCGSDRLDRYSATDDARDEVYYIIECKACGWGDWTQ